MVQTKSSEDSSSDSEASSSDLQKRQSSVNSSVTTSIKRAKSIKSVAVCETSSDSEADKNNSKNSLRIQERRSSVKSVKDASRSSLNRSSSIKTDALGTTLSDSDESSHSYKTINKSLSLNNAKNSSRIQERRSSVRCVDSSSDLDKTIIKSPSWNNSKNSSRTQQRRSSDSDSDSNESVTESVEKKGKINVHQNIVLSPSNKIDTNKIKQRYSDCQQAVVDDKLHLSNLSNNEEFYLLQVPIGIDPDLLEHMLINLDSDTIINIDANEYVCKPSSKQCDPVFVVSDNLKTFNVKSTLCIKENVKIKKKATKTLANMSIVPMPENLKKRHPLFGDVYKKKIILDKSVEKKLKESMLNVEESDRELKKKKKRKKVKIDSEEALKDEMIMKLFNPDGNSLFHYDEPNEMFVKTNHVNALEETNKRKSKKNKNNESVVIKDEMVIEPDIKEVSRTKSKKKHKTYGEPTDLGVLHETITEINSLYERKKKKKKNKKSYEENEDDEVFNDFSIKTISSLHSDNNSLLHNDEPNEMFVKTNHVNALEETNKRKSKKKKNNESVVIKDEMVIEADIEEVSRTKSKKKHKTYGEPTDLGVLHETISEINSLYEPKKKKKKNKKSYEENVDKEVFNGYSIKTNSSLHSDNNSLFLNDEHNDMFYKVVNPAEEFVTNNQSVEEHSVYNEACNEEITRKKNKKKRNASYDEQTYSTAFDETDVELKKKKDLKKEEELTDFSTLTVSTLDMDKKKKKKKLKNEITDERTLEEAPTLSSSLMETKKKKKKKMDEEPIDDIRFNGLSANINKETPTDERAESSCIVETKKTKRKRRMSVSAINIMDVIASENKKKRNASYDEQTHSTAFDETDVELKKKKDLKKEEELTDFSTLTVSTLDMDKKKKKKKLKNEITDERTLEEAPTLSSSSMETKKKKKKKMDEEPIDDIRFNGLSANVKKATPTDERAESSCIVETMKTKRKRRMSVSAINIMDIIASEASALKIDLDKPPPKIKRRKSMCEERIMEASVSTSGTPVKKNKLSVVNSTLMSDVVRTPSFNPEVSLISPEISKKKKKSEDGGKNGDDTQNLIFNILNRVKNQLNTSKEKKKRKHRSKDK